MLKFLSVVAAAAALTLPVHTHAQSTQQGKMKLCNTEAKGKAGDERKAFMKSCLSADKSAPVTTAGGMQPGKMKSCNAEARGKSGADRKAFMKSCLSA